MKKLIISALVVLLGIFCVASLPTAPVSAAEEDTVKPPVWIQVSPVSKRLYLSASTNYDDEFTVENIGSEAFTFKVYASPYSVVGENYDLNFTQESKYTQIARWIRFDQTEFELAVGEKKTVYFTIEVPADVPAGGQYATIFAESSGKNDPEAQTSGIKTVSRIGLVVYADLGGETRQSPELLEYNVPSFYFSGNISAGAKIKNSGNTDFEVRQKIEVRPLIGDVVYQKEEVYAILPETERRLSSTWEQTPLLGIYKVNYSVTAPNIERNQTALVFVIPIFVIIIVLLLLTSIAVWVTLRVKRRRGLQKKMHIS